MDSAPSEGGQGMDISDVSSEEAESVLQDLLVRKESPKLEFKRVSGEMVAKALRTVCAFANTRGGFLVLGVGDLKAGQGRRIV
jgi:ATP-dependent DNA helicase RecG